MTDEPRMKIMIDPGHGGADPGATPAHPVEADINLHVAHMLALLLQTRGYQPILTRERDETVHLSARSGLEQRQRPACFVSIHCNSAFNDQAHGFEIFHAPGSVRGQALAERIFDAVEPMGRRMRRGDNGAKAKSAKFWVLMNTRCPAVLVELGFVSHADERAYLLNHGNQAHLAESIANGIDRWIKEG